MRKSFIISLILLLPIVANANVSLPSIFSNNMVLQQNSKIKLWGWAKPHEPVKITTSWDGATINTKGAADASWSVEVTTPKGSNDTYNIFIEGYNKLTISNIAIGEVILCSGQSNMEWSVGAGFLGKEALVANANEPNIRMFNVDYRTAETPCHDVSGYWQVTTPQNVESFSAIGYVIAHRLSSELDVPIGIVNSSWGGTPIEAWTPSLAYEMCDYLRTANEQLAPNEWGPNRPGAIYNAMLAPLAHYVFSAAAWYQGEANVDNAYAYTDMMFSLVNGFREIFGAKLPFIFAQIAPYNYGHKDKGVEIRDRQRRALQIPNTAMVVIGDLGDTTNIHPQKKIEAGERFANALLNEVYGKKEFAYAAPLFDKMTIEGNKAIITFTNAEGLHCKGGKQPDWFEIAGDDNIFYTAKAVLKNGEIILTSSKVKVPKNVRYAWSDTASPNLFNSNGVQASCFTTIDN